MAERWPSTRGPRFNLQTPNKHSASSGRSSLSSPARPETVRAKEPAKEIPEGIYWDWYNERIPESGVDIVWFGFVFQSTINGTFV